MKIYPRTRPIRRYIALDIHKEYVFVGGKNFSRGRIACRYLTCAWQMDDAAAIA